MMIVEAPNRTLGIDFFRSTYWISKEAPYTVFYTEKEYPGIPRREQRSTSCVVYSLKPKIAVADPSTLKKDEYTAVLLMLVSVRVHHKDRFELAKGKEEALTKLLKQDMAKRIFSKYERYLIAKAFWRNTSAPVEDVPTIH